MCFLDQFQGCNQFYPLCCLRFELILSEYWHKGHIQIAHDVRFQGEMCSMLNRTICIYVFPAEYFCIFQVLLNFEIMRAYPKSGCTVARFGIFNKVKVRFLFKIKFYFIVKSKIKKA